MTIVVLGSVALVVAILAGVALLLAGIFWLVGRASARIVARVEQEGVVRRTGPLSIKTTLRNYRSPSRYSSYRASKNRGEVLLLREALVVVSGLMMHRFALADMPHAEVAVEGDTLRFKTTKPTGASGEVEVTFSVPDAREWQGALLDHGAREQPRP